MTAAGARVALHCEQAARGEMASARYRKQESDGIPRGILTGMLLEASIDRSYVSMPALVCEGWCSKRVQT